MKKLAMAYQRKGMIFLHASSMTTDGVWILDAPALCVKYGDVPLLGKQVLAALRGSKENVPHPSREELGRLFDPVLRLANVKSWGTLSKSAQCVSIECEGGAFPSFLKVTGVQRMDSGRFRKNGGAAHLLKRNWV
jgi:hypothetical protein